ncbi:MAG: GH92 family glycosyl hydrolase [Dysgonomonas sp.]|nr:GH92 family glycosyl hydrolase [Dysgonomonas sp.]
MKNSYLFTIICSLLFSVTSLNAQDYTKYVKTDIGTAHCRWFHYAPGSVPFGMAKAGPSTDGHLGNPGGWQAVGYDCRHNSIEGFPNFHEFQVGGVVFAPIVGKLQTIPGKLDAPESGYRSLFDKKDEVSTPGYYSVKLKDYDILAELTATKRVVFHKYTFPKSEASHILFDIGNKQGESGEVVDAFVEFDGKNRIEGYVITNPFYVNWYQKGADVRMYFSAEISKQPNEWGTFVGEKTYPSENSRQGKGAGIYLTYDTNEGESVQVKAGLSYTSIENARLNMDTEAKNLSFDKAKTQAINQWNEQLGRIAVEGGKNEDFTKFYTGLYHALLGRGLASDVNGAYPKNDGSVGQIPLGKDKKPLHNHYNTDAIWGGFWNLTQLWSIAYPEYFSDWIKSQLLVYKDAGWLGDGIACSKYVSGVGTNFTGLAIAAAYNCGIKDFDINLAYEAALKNELEWKDRKDGAGKLDVKQFVELGYSPYADELHMKTTLDGSGFGASHTLEYCFSSYAVANFAKSLGKTGDYKKLKDLSNGWRKLYDSSLKLIRPKYKNGEFISDFKPHEPWRGFQEGNAVQYTFYVPHQIEQLIDTVGCDIFNNRLDSIFQLSRENIFGGGTTIDAFAGLHTAYNHGNQPNLHISWLFNFSKRPDLTQKWVRAICNEFYGTDDVHGYGYGQDEDQGQLGAWYVMSAIGLFDVKGLTGEKPSFQIGSPLFDKITIKTNKKYHSGKKLVIQVDKESTNAMYVDLIRFGNRNISNNSIDFEDVVNGGLLHIKLTDHPAYKD